MDSDDRFRGGTLGNEESQLYAADVRFEQRSVVNCVVNPRFAAYDDDNDERQGNGRIHFGVRWH